MPKLKITGKILLSLCGLSLASLTVFGIIAVKEVENLGAYALRSNDSLGDEAVSDSRRALMNLAEQNLLQIAQDQAALSNALLEKVENEINILTHQATLIWNNRQIPKQKKSYSQNEGPPDKYKTSFYFLTQGTEYEKIKEELALSGKMDDVFISIHSNDSNLDSIYLGTESGIFRGYPWMTGLEPSYDHKKRPWYTKAVEEKGLVWSRPYISAADHELIITCSKPFYGKEGNLLGVVEADVTLQMLNDRILSTQIGKEGYAFLIDEKANLITHPGLKADNAKWDERYLTKNLLDSNSPALRDIASKMIAGKVGIRKFSGDPIVEGDDKYIAYAPLKTTGWSLGVAMPVNEIIAPAIATQKRIDSITRDVGRHIYSERKGLVKALITMLIIVTVFVALVAIVLSKKITKPIISLCEGANIVGRGNLDYTFNIKTGDEIETLASAFNKMTQDLKVYIKNLEETTRAKEKIESELQVAREIQTSMLPRIFPPFPDRKEFDIYATMDTAKEVGGDLYDFFMVDKNKLCFLVGDVSGKGIAAALFMAIVKTLLKTAALQTSSPERTLNLVNNILAPDNEASMFVTVLCVMLDIETGQVEFSNGGHNPPLLSTDNQTFDFLEVEKGFVVGVMENSQYKKQTLTLKPNQIFFLYTDGVTEAMNKQKQMFSEQRLREYLSSCKINDAKDIISGVREKVQAFTQNEPQSDDITMLTLKYNGRA